MDRCQEKAPVTAEVAGRVGWAGLWDTALDFERKTMSCRCSAE